MQDNSANSRDFNSMSVAGLSDEARQAVNTAFDAMSAWRIDIANSNEKNSEQVIEKMAAAARALGWPEQIVDATRAQLHSITKMQIQIIDQMMDIWQEQIKSPNPMAATSAMLSKLKSLPGASPATARVRETAAVPLNLPFTVRSGTTRAICRTMSKSLRLGSAEQTPIT